MGCRVFHGLLAFWGLAVLLSVVAAEEPVVLESQGASRDLLQFSGQVLPDDFKIPKGTCKRAGPYPFMVSVRDRNGDHLCGGVLIKKDAVLTAAHCVDVRVSTNSNPRPTVFLGGWDRDNPIEKRKTVDTIVPESWTGDVIDGSDIAILKLDKPSCLLPMPILGTKLKPSQELEFLGFGRSSIGGSFSFLLQAGKFKYVTNKRCAKAFDLKEDLTFRSVCIKGPNSAGVCAGDDGGPVLHRPTIYEFKDELVGIASYTTGDCTDVDAISIFTRVKAFIPWIKRSLKEK
ncbi:hypothetical protein BSKO_09981 [Bryopsis sp. KO-2023]|nr:hypothetical protein BSKO_09981 [Bryopsis sp. KO-2023]